MSNIIKFNDDKNIVTLDNSNLETLDSYNPPKKYSRLRPVNIL